MRLIDADALIQEIKRWKEREIADGLIGKGIKAGYDAAMICVSEMPTIEERKHGHWIEHPTLFGTWVCSECGMTIYNFYKADKLYIYCPKCGAKMDGDTK